LMYLLAFVAMDTVSSIVVYYMKYYLGRGDETSFVNGTLLVAQVVSLPFYTALSRRTNKRTGYITGALIWIGAMLTSFLLAPSNPSFVIYVFATVVGLGTGGIVVMIYAIFPDIPDVDELNTGQRREGIYAALVTFARKLSSAVAIFAVSNAIAWAGYVTPLEETSGGITRLIEQPQSATFILVLRGIFALVPIILLFVALAFALRYPLTSQTHLRLNHLLTARRSGEPLTPEQQTESADLRRILIGE